MKNYYTRKRLQSLQERASELQCELAKTNLEIEELQHLLFEPGSNPCDGCGSGANPVNYAPCGSNPSGGSNPLGECEFEWSGSNPEFRWSGRDPRASSHFSNRPIEEYEPSFYSLELLNEAHADPAPCLPDEPLSVARVRHFVWELLGGNWGHPRLNQLPFSQEQIQAAKKFEEYIATFTGKP